MKLLICCNKLLFFIFYFLFANIYAFSEVSVLYIVGDIFLQVGAQTTKITGTDKKFNLNDNTIKTGEKSKIILLINEEIEIRCDENTKVSFKKDFIDLNKGRIWVRKLKSKNDLELFFNNKKYSIKYGSFNFDLDNKSFNIYDGVIFNSEKRVSLIQDKKNTNEDEWLKWNLLLDKINLIILCNNIEFKKDLENIFNTTLKNKYIISDIKYFYNTDNNIDGDIVLDCDIIVNTSCVQIKAQLKDGLPPETFNLINIDCNKIDAGLYNLVSGLLNIIEIEYIKRILKNRRKMIIEVENFKKNDIFLLEKKLRDIPGLLVIDKQEFYGQKIVFRVLYYGTGYDIVNLLKESKIKIWKYSKNIVKLNIIK